MKILIIASLYEPYVRGGGEVSTKLLVEGLIELGHEVVVVTTFTEEKVDFIDKVKVWRIKTPNIYWSFESHKASKFKKIIWHTLDSYNFMVRSKFEEILKIEKPDIVHSSTIEDISPYVWKISKENKIPVVHTLRSYILMCPQATMYKNNKNCDKQCLSCKTITYPKKILSQNIDAVVGISKFILNKHLTSGYFKNSVLKDVIYNPYIMSKSNNINDNQNDEIIFGFVGRLDKSKGIEFLLTQFKKSNIENKLYVFGTTNDKSYEEYLKLEYQDERIIFFGHKTPDYIYNNITHLIVPSLWHEPFGRIIIEANAYGIPVLGSNRGGIPEIIEVDKTGYIFNPGQENNFLDMLNKIKKMKFNKEYIKKYAYKFGKKDIGLKYLAIYTKLVNK